MNGEVFAAAPIGPRRNFVMGSLASVWGLGFGEVATLVAQIPLRRPPYGEPEPDAMLLRLPEEQYRDCLPEAEDVLLLIQVSNTTLRFDRAKKLPRYAAGIPEVWIVPGEGLLESYRHPHGACSGESKTCAEREAVSPLAFVASVRWWA